MKAHHSNPQGGLRRTQRATRGALSGLAVAAALSVLPALPSVALANPDASILWLAAGAHGAPCRQTNRCATNLACDPATRVCLKPGRLELSFVNVQLCAWDDATGVNFAATNVGEIAANENVSVNATITGSYVDAQCSPDGPGLWHGWSWEIFNDNAQLHMWPSATVPVQLAPGARTELSANLTRSFPPYTYSVTLDTTISSSSGGFARDVMTRSIPKAPYLDLDKDCAPVDAICNN